MNDFISEIETNILAETPNVFPGLAFKLASSHRNIAEYESGEERVFQVVFGECVGTGFFNSPNYSMVYEFQVIWKYKFPKEMDFVSQNTMSVSDVGQTINTVLKADYQTANVYAVQFVEESGLQTVDEIDGLLFRAVKFTVEFC